MKAVASCFLLLSLRTVSSQGVEVVNGLNPGTIPLATRQSWCQSQQKTCTQVCQGSGQRPGSNTCDYNVLSSLCECGDGSFPDVSQFSNSLASLACNWQLSSCLTNATTSTAQSSCQYQYLCGGRNPLDAIGSSSTTSSAIASSTSAPSAASSSSPSSDRTSGGSSRQEPASIQHKSYAWVAAPVVVLIALLVAVILGLWWNNRRKKQKPIRNERQLSDSSSSDDAWGKAELDGSSKEILELHAHSKAFQLHGDSHGSHAEIYGSRHQPAELDGSSPLPQEMSTVSMRLQRSNAYRSPISANSPYSWDGEVSPAASTIADSIHTRQLA